MLTTTLQIQLEESVCVHGQIHSGILVFRVKILVPKVLAFAATLLNLAVILQDQSDLLDETEKSIPDLQKKIVVGEKVS